MPPPCDDNNGMQLIGHWLDSIGNSILVSQGATAPQELLAVITPLADGRPDARDRVLTIRRAVDSGRWRCGSANLTWVEDHQKRLVWLTDDGRRCVWSRTGNRVVKDTCAFPWLLNTAHMQPWLPLSIPRDILNDAARVAALLDVRQLIGACNEPQERLTRILMDHDLQPNRGDYLLPAHDSPVWDTLDIPKARHKAIRQRMQRVPQEVVSQRIAWNGDNEIWVGHHIIHIRTKDVQTLESRWAGAPNDTRMPLEIARLLALYSIFDNPQSTHRNGVHLALDPLIRSQCDYELFASPLNAVVPNGHFASKWPHVECRFGSMGAYPTAMAAMAEDHVVCVNPPFTDAYLADVMSRVEEMKARFRLKIAIPIQDKAWRSKLNDALPNAKMLHSYYDASDEKHADLLHPTLLWEDPRCPQAHVYNQHFCNYHEEEEWKESPHSEWTEEMPQPVVKFHADNYHQEEEVPPPVVYFSLAAAGAMAAATMLVHLHDQPLDASRMILER